MAFTALVSTGWMKQFRRITTRYEKRAANYLAMITVAAILLWL
jgi:transposase